MYLNIGDGDNALKWLNKILSLREFLNEHGMAAVCLRFGAAYRLINEFEKEEQKILEARRLFKKLGETEMVDVCDGILEQFKNLK